MDGSVRTLNICSIALWFKCYSCNRFIYYCCWWRRRQWQRQRRRWQSHERCEFFIHLRVPWLWPFAEVHMYVSVCIWLYIVYPQALFQLDFNRAQCVWLWCIADYIYAFIRERTHFAWIDTANEQSNIHNTCMSIWPYGWRSCGGHDNDHGHVDAIDSGGNRNGDSNKRLCFSTATHPVHVCPFYSTKINFISMAWRVPVKIQAPHSIQVFVSVLLDFLGIVRNNLCMCVRELCTPAKVSFHASTFNAINWMVRDE